MAAIIKRKIKGKEYYYLKHSIKVDNKVKSKEKYLGKEIPKNIKQIKKEFEDTIKKEQWFSKINIIKRNFNKEFKSMPKPAREKYTKQFAVKFTYNTERIEGSTLTLKETADLLEEGIAPNKSIADIKETQAHEKIFYNMLNYKGYLNLKKIIYWHKILLKDTKPAIAGIIRKHNVRVGRSIVKFPDWQLVSYLLKQFFEWYEKNKNKIHPIELASLVHLKFVSMHPFIDGNGRISRLLMNFILKKNEYPMMDIPYDKRINYYNALEKVQLKKSDEFSFVKHIIHRYLKEYKKYL